MKYLIFGYGGKKNKGCEALLITTISQIKKYDPNSFIIVAVFDYDNEIKNSSLGVDKYIRHNHADKLTKKENDIYLKYIASGNTEGQIRIEQKEVLNATKIVDICLSIGGDNYSEGNVPYLHCINMEAKKNGCKLILWGCSLYEKIEDFTLIEDLQLFDIILTRESLTYNALKSFINSNKLLLFADPAFGLSYSNNLEIKKYKKYICINISDIIIKNNVHSFNDICSLIKYILNKYDYNIVLIPHVYVDIWNDFNTLQLIKKEFLGEKKLFILDDKKEYSCEELKYVIANSVALIAARTHASIAGYSTKVPTIVLGYSIKSKGLALDLFDNIKDFVIPYQYLNYEILKNKFDNLINNIDKIKKIYNKKIPKYINDSKKLINYCMDKIQENERKTICEKCIGCSACASICPTKAITMSLNKQGFINPIIDLSKCIGCNKCRSVCPQLKEQKTLTKPIGYAYSTQDEVLINKSSSGGFFGEASKIILNNNGVVYGATYFNKNINHIRVANINDLEQLYGSKYVESNMQDSFLKVKQDLDNKIKVLFTGTPCQIAGLKSFLNKEYNNLLTISVVCHGTPSQTIFTNYLNELELKLNDKIINVNFRKKVDSWEDYNINIETTKYSINELHYNNIFMKGFLNNLYLKENCYTCKYHLYDNNISDIIIGDFWGVKNSYPKLYNELGTSIIISNSNKGEKFINKFFGNKVVIINISKIKNCNTCLIKPVPYEKFYKKRELFFSLYNEYHTLNIVNYLLNQFNEKLSKENTIIMYENEIKKFELKNNDLENLIIDKDNEIKKIMNSKSWKLTAPIRNFNSIIRKKYK